MINETFCTRPCVIELERQITELIHLKLLYISFYFPIKKDPATKIVDTKRITWTP